MNMTTLASEGEWRLRATCTSLTFEEADSIFFSGSGSKPTKAKAFCATCPVKGECLKDAIRYKLDGFIAGTTKSERTIMAEQFGLDQFPISDLVKDLLPEAGRRRRYLHVIKPPGDTLDYLDTIQDPLLAG